MNINWNTVFFQIINFLIIVWILKKYLFKPVLSAMDKREKIIQDRLKEAEKVKLNAENERKRLEQEILDLEKSKKNVMAETYKTAEKEHALMIKTFNAEMIGKRQAFNEQMLNERDMLQNSIKEITGKAIVQTVSDALQNLTNINIQNLIIDGFIEKIQEGKIRKAQEVKKFYTKNKIIYVQSSFKLSVKQKTSIKQAFMKLMNIRSINVEFKTDESILCGLEIVCTPMLISYGMNTYITELQKNIDDGLAEITKTTNKNKV